MKLIGDIDFAERVKDTRKQSNTIVWFPQHGHLQNLLAKYDDMFYINYTGLECTHINDFQAHSDSLDTNLTNKVRFCFRSHLRVLVPIMADVYLLHEIVG